MYRGFIIVGMVFMSGFHIAPAQADDWGGFYIGGQTGAGSTGGVSATTSRGGETARTDGKLDGGVFGVTGGYNWQFNDRWMAGVEASWLMGGISQSATGIFRTPDTQDATKEISNTFQTKVGLQNILTIGPRLGFVHDNFLFYGEGGYASADLEVEGTFTRQNTPSVSASASKGLQGVFFGAGIEWNVGPLLAVGVEYNRFEFDDLQWPNVNVAGNASSVSVVDSSTDLITMKAMYRFQ